jgi:hypothetical protein
LKILNDDIRDLNSLKSNKIIKITSRNTLKKIILSGKFDDSIQVKNNEHICKDGSIYDYSNVTDMSFMFHNCIQLKSMPLLDTTAVFTMSNMFYGCSSLISFPKLDISNVIDFTFIFGNCTSLTSIPLFDISNAPQIPYMRFMFSNCSSLSKIDLVKFFYQKDKLLLKNLETNPQLFLTEKLDKLLEKYN